MKSFRFLSIILCTIIGISTYDANGMDTPRPRSNSFSYNKVNRINIIQNAGTKIKNSAKFLEILEEEASTVACGGSSAVKKLCSVIDSAKINDAGLLMIDSNILKTIKRKLLNDAKIYVDDVKCQGYRCEVMTMSYMINIFNRVNQLMNELSPDNIFYKQMESCIKFIKQYFVKNGIDINNINAVNDVFIKTTKSIATELRNNNEIASEVADGGSPAVTELCSVIIDFADNNPFSDYPNSLVIDSNILEPIKQKLLDDANFYIKEIKTNEYCSDRNTISFMIDIFDTAKQLMERISPDIEFYTKINSYVNSMKNYIASINNRNGRTLEKLL